MKHLTSNKAPVKLDLLRTSKQIHSEAIAVIYGKQSFQFERPGLLARFLETIGPKSRACLKWIYLHNVRFSGGFNDPIDDYRLLPGLKELCEFVITFNSDVLDVVAAENEPFRTRFAAQLACDGRWHTQESKLLKNGYIKHLSQITRHLVSQGMDEAGKRERFGVIGVDSDILWPTCSERAEYGCLEVEEEDYYEVSDSIMPMLEREFTEEGLFESS